MAWSPRLQINPKNKTKPTIEIRIDLDFLSLNDLHETKSTWIVILQEFIYNQPSSISLKVFHF
jgi:hypothetical protein